MTVCSNKEALRPYVAQKLRLCEYENTCEYK